MAWIVLLISGLLECGWAIGLKMSDGFTKLWPSVFTVLAVAVSFGGLSWALRSLPVGTAYAVWTGIGAAGTALVGMLLFKEPATALRFVSIALIVAGIVGLKFAG